MTYLLSPTKIIKASYCLRWVAVERVKMKAKAVFDCEVSPTKSMVGFMDLESFEVKQFDSSEGAEIKEYVKDRELIGFNSLNYDDIIVTEMINGTKAKHIYDISVDLIEQDGCRWDYKTVIKSIDLIEVAVGTGSLKIYGARLDTKKLQDLPFDPHEKHSKKMWREVCKYNINDLVLTEELYQELLPQLDIRADIGSRYGIDVMSRSDAQIAEDVFKKALKIFKKPKIDKPKYVEYRAPMYVKFKTKELNALKEKFESTTYEINAKTGKFVPQEWLKEKVNIDGNDYTIGFGGMHSNEKSLVVKNLPLCDIDVASYYPALIINSGKYPIQLGADWLNLYRGFRDERMKIKHTDKALSAVLKILLNGSYGKLNSVYSILYAPHLMLDTTITGQLSLLMLIESLTLAGVSVFSVNTDGLSCDYTKQKKIKKIVSDWEEKTNLVMEYSPFTAMYNRDVNNYIAVYDGYVKAKGYFGEHSLSKNPQYPIVTEAIRQFLLDGVSIEETIRNCKVVSKFCFSRAVSGGALYSRTNFPNSNEYEEYMAKVPFKQNKALEKRNENYQKEFLIAEGDKNYIGKTIRVYFSIVGRPLFYKKSHNKVPLTGEYNSVRPMMQLKKKIPKDLDYDAYISIAKKDLILLGVKK